MKTTSHVNVKPKSKIEQLEERIHELETNGVAIYFEEPSREDVKHEEVEKSQREGLAQAIEAEIKLLDSVDEYRSSSKHIAEMIAWSLDRIIKRWRDPEIEYGFEDNNFVRINK